MGGAVCQWGDFALLNWDRVLQYECPWSRASCFYVRAGLVRKAMLAHYMKKRKVEGIIPLGLVVDLEDESDIENLRKSLSDCRLPHSPGHPAFVAKASNANRGEHLFVARTVDDVVHAVRPGVLDEGVSEWVVQRYIAPPLLIHGRKFHVRTHFVVSGCPRCGMTRAWVHSSCNALLVATSEYSLNHEDRYAHLTNHCVQERHALYDESRQIMLLAELDNLFGKPGLAVRILSKMEDAVALALAAASSAPAAFAALPQCFELFGADFALEDRAEEDPIVWLLEVNAGPDLGIFGTRLRPQCVTLIEDTLRVAVEPHLVEDIPGTFVSADSCYCASAAEGSGYGRCLWSLEPRGSSAADELERFKRRLSIAGRWVKMLHEGSGVAVRGPQGISA